MDFIGYFTPAAVTEFLTTYDPNNNTAYLGRGLFPAKKKAGLDLAWFTGHRGVPISLMPSAFDAKATFRDRIGFSKLETEMPFFREGFKIKERDRQNLFRALDSNDPYAQEAINFVFDDVAELRAAAAVVPERMIMQLLFPEDGNLGISIKANGVDYTYNYDPDGFWKTDNYIELTGAELWTAPDTADPFAAFKRAKDAIRNKTGSVPTIALMNGSTFNLLLNMASIKDRFLTTNGRSFSYLSEAEVKSVVSGMNNLTIATYDKTYRDEDGNVHTYVPDGYVALLPSGSLGNTWYGTTPEEADLMGQDTNAQVSIIDTGVAITRIVEEHPVNINFFASEIVLPSFERMSEVAVLKVTD